MGDIHLGRGGRYEATIVAPTALCQAAVGKGSILVGWSRVRVFPVRPRPLRCHRCLARGHVAASCPAPSARMGVCFGCGEPGHVAKDCGDKPKCPICVEAGRSQISHRAGSWECPLVPPIRGRDIILGVAAGRRDTSGRDIDVLGSAGDKTRSQTKSVVISAGPSAGPSVENDMEVEQVNPAPPCSL
ncbi:zinc finger CCHC domain-containing protein 13-like [Polistes fuscatus]|uniref:zinc finger CCHC domain-containing protein 13-like n=1 Tax=Polistes fuscatus TaxID=30207 RepID=UPI001CA9F3E6|nr:zinc finger CCHC domain-containing protein 13-like [Polistes fuscatus]